VTVARNSTAASPAGVRADPRERPAPTAVVAKDWHVRTAYADSLVLRAAPACRRRAVPRRAVGSPAMPTAFGLAPRSLRRLPAVREAIRRPRHRIRVTRRQQRTRCVLTAMRTAANRSSAVQRGIACASPPAPPAIRTTNTFSIHWATQSEIPDRRAALDSDAATPPPARFARHARASGRSATSPKPETAARVMANAGFCGECFRMEASTTHRGASLVPTLATDQASCVVLPAARTFRAAATLTQPPVSSQSFRVHRPASAHSQSVI